MSTTAVRRAAIAAAMTAVLVSGGCEVAPKPVSVSCTAPPNSPPDIVRLEPSRGRATLLSVSPARTGRLAVTDTGYDAQFDAAEGAPALQLHINRYSLAYRKQTGGASGGAQDGACERFRERPL